MRFSTSLEKLAIPLLGTKPKGTGATPKLQRHPSRRPFQKVLSYKSYRQVLLCLLCRQHLGLIKDLEVKKRMRERRELK